MLSYPLIALASGFDHPALALIGAVAVGGFVLWALWLGREFHALTGSDERSAARPA